MQPIGIQNINPNSLGILKDVFCNVDKDCSNAINRIYLKFEKGILIVSVNVEDDTISLFKKRKYDIVGKSDKGLHAFSKSIAKLISEVKTLSIQWIWELTNQQGYQDGLQFEFTDKNNPDISVTIQFLAICSAIKIKKVKTIK